jgi:16S rRNA (cytidine1402-2'-O)-methyltransferase
MRGGLWDVSESISSISYREGGLCRVALGDCSSQVSIEMASIKTVENGLYVVATPIGNLGDIVPRAVEILQSVDLIAAEDTRHSAPLLKHLDIETPMISYHDHSDTRAQERISRCIEAGGSVALISDAGTPLVSDPGYRLVRHAHEEGWKVVPVPGACAAIAALSVAGLPTDRFRFEGFLPAKAAARKTCLQSLAGESLTLVFYEAPHRVVESLADMRDVLGGERMAVLARELTKAFETVLRAPLGELANRVAADADQQRGEIVLLVEGAPAMEMDITPEIARMLEILSEMLPPRQAAGVVADAFGIRKKSLYEYLISR